MPDQKVLWTRRTIAERFRVSVEQADYVIKSRNVRPMQWVGHARLFGDQEVALIGRELRKIAAKQTSGSLAE